MVEVIRDIEEEAPVLNKAGKQKEAIALVTSFSYECLKDALEARESIC
ncbi:hypothetical protein (plasmid) [Metabacillus dongyingensis]|nr:hypothetical protein [Metabacillus dongyingensis]